MSEAERQALNDVITTLKDHTEQLKTSREDLASVKKQVEETRKMIAELFDKAMGVLLVRRKNLENSINSTEAEVAESLKKRVNDLQNSAKHLFKCKQTIEQQFRTMPGGPERQQFVTSSVEAALKGCPSNVEERVRITFDQGNTPLLEFLENFGSVGVGRQKETQET